MNFKWHGQQNFYDCLRPHNWKIGLINSKSSFQTVLPGIRMVEEQINKTGNVYNVIPDTMETQALFAFLSYMALSTMHKTGNVCIMLL